MTTLQHTFPSQKALAETAAELALAAQQAEDERNMNALNKAAYHLASGLRIVESAGALLIPSATTTGQVYRVDGRGCTCGAGLKGLPCWHLAMSEIVSTARERGEEGVTTLPTLCCGEPLHTDGNTAWCEKCRHWEFI